MSKQPPADTPKAFEVTYVHTSNAISDLEGKILTFIDAAISDPIQRKAMKDLLRPMIWSWSIETNTAENYDIKRKPYGNASSNS